MESKPTFPLSESSFHYRKHVSIIGKAEGGLIHVGRYPMPIEIRKIEEFAPNVYGLFLWAPTSEILHELLTPQMPYVLCWGYGVGNYTWSEMALPLLDFQKSVQVLSRRVAFDFILPTEKFLEILPMLGSAIRAVQLNTQPPDYLDMERIKGTERYRILKECGWHILLDTPANDYGLIMSPDRKVLEKAIALDTGDDH